MLVSLVLDVVCGFGTLAAASLWFTHILGIYIQYLWHSMFRYLHLVDFCWNQWSLLCGLTLNYANLQVERYQATIVSANHAKRPSPKVRKQKILASLQGNSIFVILLFFDEIPIWQLQPTCQSLNLTDSACDFHFW